MARTSEQWCGHDQDHAPPTPPRATRTPDQRRGTRPRTETAPTTRPPPGVVRPPPGGVRATRPTGLTAARAQQPSGPERPGRAQGRGPHHRRRPHQRHGPERQPTPVVMADARRGTLATREWTQARRPYRPLPQRVPRRIVPSSASTIPGPPRPRDEARATPVRRSNSPIVVRSRSIRSSAPADSPGSRVAAPSSRPPGRRHPPHRGAVPWSPGTAGARLGVEAEPSTDAAPAPVASSRGVRGARARGRGRSPRRR